MKFSNNFNIIQSSYYEITRNSNGNIIKETWYPTAAKLLFMREVEYTYTGNLITQIVAKQYNEFGTLIETYTQILVYSGDDLVSITGTVT